MKKIMIIISVLTILYLWLSGCTMKGEEDFVGYYIYHRTPSPTVTCTITPTPVI